jgi:CxxC motif-containing protein (DUF1111 family)
MGHFQVWSATALAGVVLALPSNGQSPADDPHLMIMPLTAEETALVGAMTAPARDFSVSEPQESQPGGAATGPAGPDLDVFSQPSANLTLAGEEDFRLGNRLFRKLWVAAPSRTPASDGLGPLYNARSCQICHLKDGRGHPPEPGMEDEASIVLRLSVPAPAGATETAIEGFLASLGEHQPGTRPDPVYGGQFQDQAAPGHPAEHRLSVTYDEIEVLLSGGEIARLRRPTHAAADLGYGPVGVGAMLSARVAPQLIGLGLLEAVPAADILAGEDAQDRDGDGISGRANIVWSAEFGQPTLGRFGQKAGSPTIREQVAAAFSVDMGLSTPLFTAAWGDCTVRQPDCLAAPHGGGEAPGEGAEVDAAALDLLVFYARNLAVPERRGSNDPKVLRGKEVFHAVGCAACHRPKFVTHRLTDRPEQSFQLIWPHTDLLLHDMGEGLADHRPESRATGREWRTAPLWGIGLTAQVSGHTLFLHDGRARSLLEAVLWHGGEAEAARSRVVALPPEDRAALLGYLESL